MKQDIGNSYTGSIQYNHSYSKLSRNKNKNMSNADGKKNKKNKHTSSVINLGKATE